MKTYTIDKINESIDHCTTNRRYSMKQKFKFDLASRMVSIDNDDIWQTVPAKWDASDYRYDHGGTVYQEACRAFWMAEER